MDYDKIETKSLKYYEFFGDPRVYIFFILLAATMSYFALIHINNLPKPETFIELCKYLYRNPSGYFTTFILCLFSFLIVLLVGLITIGHGIKFSDFPNWLRWIIGGTGGVTSVFSLYLLSYFLILTIVLIAIFIGIGIIIWLFSNSR